MRLPLSDHARRWRHEAPVDPRRRGRRDGRRAGHRLGERREVGAAGCQGEPERFPRRPRSRQPGRASCVSGSSARVAKASLISMRSKSAIARPVRSRSRRTPSIGARKSHFGATSAWA